MPILPGSGGDRYADVGIVVEAIKKALAVADDDEIRAAFGMADWRVVTEEIRTRYAEYFAPKAYWAICGAMASGLRGGRLSIRDFAVFEKGKEPSGQLYPIGVDPCKKSDMIKVAVTIAAGGSEYGGVVPSGVKQGAWGEWAGGVVGGPVDSYVAEYAVIDAAAGLYAVEARRELVLDYGGYFEKRIPTLQALVVRGYVENVAAPQDYPRFDLTIEDGAPDVSGLIGAPYQPASVPWGPYQAVNVIREGFPASICYSKRVLDAMDGKAAEVVMDGAAVHSLNMDGFPLTAAAFGNCFPREKWIVGRDTIVNGQTVRGYVPVRWIGRTQWMLWFGARHQELLDLGYEVPLPLVGERVVGPKIYAKFAAGVIDALNE